MASKNARIGIQVVLAIIIVVLAFVLYQSITNPWEAIERRQQLTEITRTRLTRVRSALIDYERRFDVYPSTLDSLEIYLNQHPQVVDSLYNAELTLDSLFYSPRSGEMFSYAVNDTGDVEIYLLEDPASDAKIGSLEPDPTLVNVASWE